MSDLPTTDTGMTTPSEADTVSIERRQRIAALKQELLGGDLLTAAEVAEILDIHPRTVGEYIHAGVLKAHQFGGAWKISEGALRTFVREQSRTDEGPRLPSTEPATAEATLRRGRGPRPQLRCSFCGKDQEQVRRLIAGPRGVYICNDCITLCNQMIAQEEAE